jgi:glycine hydroxymethyltransferase
MHVIAAKAVAFKEALAPEFKAYQSQIVKNAQALAATLKDERWRLVSGGTDNHLVLVDVFARGITGKVAEAALDKAGITVNKNTIPYDTNSPMVASGIRVGTPALTTRGMKEPEMEQVGRLLSRALKNFENETTLAEIKREVGKLCDRFPLYAARLESYDRALAKA